jgi:GT2 family glycosyltransferase
LEKRFKKINFDVSIVIVSYNCKEYLRKCLWSVEKEIKRSGLQVETIVVDNDSIDGTKKLKDLKMFDWVKWIDVPNRGFGAGNNVGMKESRGDYLFLLNPDTELTEGSLWKCYEYLQMNKEVDVLGPRLEYDDGTVQISAFDNFPGIISAFLENTLLDRVFYKILPNVVYPGKLFSRSMHQKGKVREMAHVLGAAMWVKRSIYKLSGGFDEKYFLFREETDWQYRIKLAGGRIVYFPKAVVIHHEGKSTGEARFKKDSWQKKLNWYMPSVYYFQKKWGGDWSMWLVWGCYIFGSMWTILILILLVILNNTLGLVLGGYRNKINKSIGNIIVYHWAMLSWHVGKLYE